MTYFNIIGAKGQKVYFGRVYLKNKFDFIKEGLSLKFKNVVPKGEDGFWAISTSTISYCAVVETTTDKTSLCLPEDEPPEGVQKPITNAITSPGKSTITGKVVKMSPLHMRMNGTLPVKAIMLKDVSSKAKVCLFGENAGHNFSVGDVVQVSAVYAKTFQNNKQLTTSPHSKCEFLADIPEIQINESDGDTNDPDFQENIDEDIIKEITLTDFMNVDYYKCCSTKACRQKKYVSGKCPVCSDEKSKEYSYRVVFHYSTENDKDKKVCLFPATIEKILKKKLDVSSADDVISALIPELPIRFKASINAANTIYNIQE